MTLLSTTSLTSEDFADLADQAITCDAARATLADRVEETGDLARADAIRSAKTGDLAAMLAKYPKAEPIVRKAWRRHGHAHPAEVVPGRYANVVPGKAITLFGESVKYGTQHGTSGRRDKETIAHERTFCIGDTASYGSYNLVYFGTITSIGQKTVTIEDHGRKHRLDIDVFDSRNYDLDLAETLRKNHETMMYI